ncbi:hypothetical protein F5B21DRAFT_452325, partial [Xylaria acuta]
MLTTLSIPTSCVTETWLSWESEASRAALVLGNPHDTNCWPGNRDLATTISPAICPEGYRSACDIDSASRRDESETAWACCPGKFRCDGGTWSCVVDNTPRVTKTYAVTDVDFFGNTIITQVMSDSGINAHSIRVAFHSSDILNQVSSTTDPVRSTEARAPTLTTSLSTPTSVAESPTAQNPTTLPAGALIGIGIGGTVSVIFVISCIAWLVRRQYKRKQQFPAPGSSEPNKPSFPEIQSIIRPTELSTTSDVHELDTRAPNTALVTGRRM